MKALGGDLGGKVSGGGFGETKTQSGDSTPSGSSSLFSSSVHELGHVIGLDHTMHRGDTSGPAAAESAAADAGGAFNFRMKTTPS